MKLIVCIISNIIFKLRECIHKHDIRSASNIFNDCFKIQLGGGGGRAQSLNKLPKELKMLNRIILLKNMINKSMHVILRSDVVSRLSI